jgi:hypothetical protein
VHSRAKGVQERAKQRVHTIDLLHSHSKGPVIEGLPQAQVAKRVQEVGKGQGSVSLAGSSAVFVLQYIYSRGRHVVPRRAWRAPSPRICTM